jgi:predicted DNA-binding transcriptional regulator YafY
MEVPTMNVLLKRALDTGEVLEMIYLSEKGEISQRKIRVLEISAGSIRAFCMLRSKQRVFKLTNILSIGPVRPKYQRGA